MARFDSAQALGLLDPSPLLVHRHEDGCEETVRAQRLDQEGTWQ
jgi:hypothetical protein